MFLDVSSKYNGLWPFQKQSQVGESEITIYRSGESNDWKSGPLTPDERFACSYLDWRNAFLYQTVLYVVIFSIARTSICHAAHFDTWSLYGISSTGSWSWLVHTGRKSHFNFEMGSVTISGEHIASIVLHISFLAFYLQMFLTSCLLTYSVLNRWLIHGPSHPPMYWVSLTALTYSWTFLILVWASTVGTFVIKLISFYLFHAAHKS